MVVPIKSILNTVNPDDAGARGTRRAVFAGFVLVLVGVFLRSRRLGQSLVFADEIHSLKSAVENSYFYIFSHFSGLDTCIPLTLYNKFLMDHIGLNEWLFRLPSLVCGAALLICVWCFMKNTFLLSESVAVTGILAASPYFVYISREARPYAVTLLLIWLSFVLVMKWRRRRRGFVLILAFVLVGLALYFHPVTAPTVFLILLYPLGLFFHEKDLRKFWLQYGLALVFFGLIITGLLGPAFGSFVEGVFQKAQTGHANAATMQSALDLLAGLPITLPLWVWGVFFIFGVISLYRRIHMDAMFIAAAVAVQVWVLFLVQPRLAEIPWVWLRYVAHLLPWFVIICAAGVIFMACLFERIGLKKSYVTGTCAILLAAWTLWHVNNKNYAIFETSSTNVHPVILMIDKDSAKIKGFPSMSRFYREIPEGFSEGQIIEAPILYTLPLYSFYQTVHGRPLRTAGIGDGYGQDIFNRHAGLNFKTVYRPAFSSEEKSNVPGLLIVHKRIKDEIAAAYAYFCEDDMAARQLSGIAYLFEMPLLNRLFGEKDLIPSAKGIAGKKLYEDEWICVFDLCKSPVKTDCRDRQDDLPDDF